MTDQPGEVISPKEHAARSRLELLATLILAVGVVLTAWIAWTRPVGRP